MMRVLGVDGGGSKTVAWIAEIDAKTDAAKIDDANNDARILGRGHSGGSNVNTLGAEAAQEAVYQAVQQAASTANCALSDLDAACFGLAGAGRETQRAEMQEWARSQVTANSVVTTDVELLLGPSGPRVGLIAGTGSLAVARNSQGQTARCGGWGPLLGDEGGGYAISVEALRAIALALDDRGPATELWDQAQDYWKVNQAADLRHALSRLSIAEIAAFAPLVFTSADGDPVAKKIVQQNVHALAQLVRQAALSTNLKSPIRLMMTGGVLINQLSYQDAVQTELESLGILLESATAIAEPVQLALAIAGELALARRPL